MKCPNCGGKLTWKSYIFKDTICPTCEATISHPYTIGLSAVLMGWVLGQMFFAGYVWESAIIGGFTLVVIALITPKRLKATLKNKSDT